MKMKSSTRTMTTIRRPISIVCGESRFIEDAHREDHGQRADSWHRIRALTTFTTPYEPQRQAFPVAHMQFLVIRHGIAEDPSTAVAAGPDDSGPPLSKEGKQMMK